MLHRLDVQLGITHRFRVFQVLTIRAPIQLDAVRGQSLARRPRIVSLGFWRRQGRYRTTAFAAHFFQQTLVTLRLKVEHDCARAGQLHIRISIERLRSDVIRPISLLQTLIGVEEVIHVDRVRLRSMTRIHHAHIRIAAHLDFLELLLVVENRRERVPAHDVLLLLGGRAARECQTHRRLLEHSLA